MSMFSPQLRPRAVINHNDVVVLRSVLDGKLFAVREGPDLPSLQLQEHSRHSQEAGEHELLDAHLAVVLRDGHWGFASEEAGWRFLQYRRKDAALCFFSTIMGAWEQWLVDPVRAAGGRSGRGQDGIVVHLIPKQAPEQKFAFELIKVGTLVASPARGASVRASRAFALEDQHRQAEQQASSYQEELLDLSREVTRGFLVRVTKFQLLLSFRCWAALVRGRRQRLVMLCASHHAKLSRAALLGWRDKVQQELRLQHSTWLADVWATSQRLRRLRACVRQWAVLAAHRTEVQGVAAAATQMLRHQKERGALARILASWYSQSLQHAAFISTLEAAANSCDRDLLAAAFGAWAAVVYTTAATTQTTNRQHCTACVDAFAKRRLAHSFVEWRVLAARRGGRGQALAAMAASRQLRSGRLVLQMWHEVACVRPLVRLNVAWGEKMRRWLLRWRQLAGQQGSRQQMAAAHAVRRAAACKVVLLRAWRSWVQRRLRVGVVLVRAVQRLSRRYLAASWKAWQVAVEVAERHATVFVLLVAWYSRVLMAWAVRGLRNQIMRRKAKELAARAHMDRLLHTTFSSWRQLAANHTCLLAHCAARRTSVVARSTAASCLTAWRASAQHSKNLQLLCHIQGTRVTARFLHAGLIGWHATASSAACLSRISTNLQRQWRLRKLRMALTAWRLHCVRFQTLEFNMPLVRARVCSSTLRTALQGWHAAAAGKSMQACTLSRAMCARQVHVLRAWRAAAAARGQRERLLQARVRKMHALRLRGVLWGWQAAAEAGSRSQELHAQHAEHMEAGRRLRRLRACLLTWKLVGYGDAARTAHLLACLKGRRLRRLVAAWRVAVAVGKRGGGVQRGRSSRSLVCRAFYGWHGLVVQRMLQPTAGRLAVELGNVQVGDLATEVQAGGRVARVGGAGMEGVDGRGVVWAGARGVEVRGGVADLHGSGLRSSVDVQAAVAAEDHSNSGTSTSSGSMDATANMPAVSSTVPGTKAGANLPNTKPTAAFAAGSTTGSTSTSSATSASGTPSQDTTATASARPSATKPTLSPSLSNASASSLSFLVPARPSTSGSLTPTFLPSAPKPPTPTDVPQPQSQQEPPSSNPEPLDPPPLSASTPAAHAPPLRRPPLPSHLSTQQLLALIASVLGTSAPPAPEPTLPTPAPQQPASPAPPTSPPPQPPLSPEPSSCGSTFQAPSHPSSPPTLDPHMSQPTTPPSPSPNPYLPATDPITITVQPFPSTAPQPTTAAADTLAGGTLPPPHATPGQETPIHVTPLSTSGQEAPIHVTPLSKSGQEAPIHVTPLSTAVSSTTRPLLVPPSEPPPAASTSSTHPPTSETPSHLHPIPTHTADHPSSETPSPPKPLPTPDLQTTFQPLFSTAPHVPDPPPTTLSPSTTSPPERPSPPPTSPPYPTHTSPPQAPHQPPSPTHYTPQPRPPSRHRLQPLSPTPVDLPTPARHARTARTAQQLAETRQLLLHQLQQALACTEPPPPPPYQHHPTQHTTSFVRPKSPPLHQSHTHKHLPYNRQHLSQRTTHNHPTTIPTTHVPQPSSTISPSSPLPTRTPAKSPSKTPHASPLRKPIYIPSTPPPPPHAPSPPTRSLHPQLPANNLAARIATALSSSSLHPSLRAPHSPPISRPYSTTHEHAPTHSAPDHPATVPPPPPGPTDTLLTRDTPKKDADLLQSIHNLLQRHKHRPPSASSHPRRTAALPPSLHQASATPDDDLVHLLQAALQQQQGPAPLYPHLQTSSIISSSMTRGREVTSQRCIELDRQAAMYPGTGGTSTAVPGAELEVATVVAETTAYRLEACNGDAGPAAGEEAGDEAGVQLLEQGYQRMLRMCRNLEQQVVHLSIQQEACTTTSRPAHQMRSSQRPLSPGRLEAEALCEDSLLLRHELDQLGCARPCSTPSSALAQT